MSAGRDEPAKNEAEHDAAAERPLLSPWARIGEDFIVNKLIGRGGQSQIYEGYDTRNERLVAIKVFLFKHQLNAAMLRRAKAEAKAEMRMVHPNIVKVHAAGVTEIQGADGRKRELFYSVMELLEGETLEDRIHRKGRLEVRETLSILAEAADGLAMLHMARIIHRDIKPENIFLAGPIDGEVEGGALRVVLIDLGIAKLDPQQFSVQRTDSNILLGTFAYMSPEQIHHKCPVDGRADLYSLGIVAFKCLTGVHPAWNHYQQPSPPPAEEYAAWHMTVVAPAVAASRPDVPAGVNELVARLLAKSPEERYRDAASAAIAAVADLREQIALASATPKAVPEAPMNRRRLAAEMAGAADRWGPFGQATTQEDEGNDGPADVKDVPVRLRDAAVTPPEGVAKVPPAKGPAPVGAVTPPEGMAKVPPAIVEPAMVPPARGPLRTSAGTEILEASAVRSPQGRAPRESARPPTLGAGDPGEVARTKSGTEIVPRQRLASLGLESGARPAAEPVTRAPELQGPSTAVPFRAKAQAAAKEARTTSGHLMSVPPVAPRAAPRKLGWVLSAVAGVLCGVLVLAWGTRRGGPSAAQDVAPITVAVPELDAGSADAATSAGDASAEAPVAEPTDAGEAADGGSANDGGSASDAGARPPRAAGGGAPQGQRVCDFVRNGCASPAYCADEPDIPQCNYHWATPAQRGTPSPVAKPTAPKATATTPAPSAAASAAPPKNRLPSNAAPQPLPPRNDRIHD